MATILLPPPFIDKPVPTISVAVTLEAKLAVPSASMRKRSVRVPDASLENTMSVAYTLLDQALPATNVIAAPD